MYISSKLIIIFICSPYHETSECLRIVVWIKRFPMDCDLVWVCGSESSRSLLIVIAATRGIWEFISMVLCCLKVCENIWRVKLRVSHCFFCSKIRIIHGHVSLSVPSVPFSLSHPYALSSVSMWQTLSNGLNIYRHSGEMAARGQSLVA